MLSTKKTLSTCHEDVSLDHQRFPAIPFLLRTLVMALWALPVHTYAQTLTEPVVIIKQGKNGRNASLFRDSTRGGASDAIRYTLGAGKKLSTPGGASGALYIASNAGNGGAGHNGVVADTTGAMGGNTGDIALTIAGDITNYYSRGAAHGIAVQANAGNAGSRMRGGTGGGSAGPVSITVNDSRIVTTSSAAAGIHVQSKGGEGNSGYQAVAIRWSGSDGGSGGTVALDLRGEIIGNGKGVFLGSEGGGGGGVDGGVIQKVGNHGGTGGRGGDIQVTTRKRSTGQQSFIETHVNGAHGLHLLSKGGEGGRITGNSWFNGADGGSGGGAGKVVATLNDLSIETNGNNASGVVAESNGGNGFWGGGSALAKGGKAGSGGSGGSVAVTLGSNVQVRTKGNEAIGVQAVSRGGGGSNGGSGGVFYSPGGDGSSGGTAGAVTLQSSAQIWTTGQDAYALYAASLGGAAGDGGKGAGIYAVGGQGGANSRSSNVELRQTAAGRIKTAGAGAHGLFAESIGGDGGTYNKTASAVLGGDGRSNSPNSHAAAVNVFNHGEVVVTGKAAKGILAQSVGGGGGNGGASAGLVSVGGDGHSSGNGGTVKVENHGSITTQGEQGYGIHVQSIGGGGGSASKTLAIGIVANVAIGGKGATAGNGGNVNVKLGNSSVVQTSGADANAIVVQSIGGGGGEGGSASSVGLDVLTKSLGGSGSAAGNGGTVNVETAGKIRTTGKGAVGVLAQSIGGGGGSGGNSLSAGITLAAIGVGGTGGVSGHGGKVNFSNRANIETSGVEAYGALLQSVGGGGGAGGNAVGVAMSFIPKYSASAAIAVGGAGGTGDSGGDIEASNLSSIKTLGNGAKVLLAQSVGGGGGTGGSAGTFSFSASLGTSLSLAVSVGGSGGAGGGGGAVQVNNEGVLSSVGHHATGILAQSVGGGGGVGGGATARAVAYGAKSFAGALSIGGKGGSGGNGGTITLTQKGTVMTTGDAALGVVAQSVGGGGGSGGLTHGDTRADSANIAIVLGRSGGSGGDGGQVTFTQSKQATITTSGINSDAVVLQSVGGGGGVGSALGDSNMPPWPEPIPIPGGSGLPQYQGYSGSLTLALGGQGGAGGKAGTITASQSGTITTTGRQSIGLLAQSVGGGGGRSGSSASSAPGGDLSLALTLGGKGGSGGDGGSITLTQDGTISTQGLDSAAVVVQSIGGGGGNASSTEAGQSAGKIGVNVALGGGGASAGHGGTVLVTQSGKLLTQTGDGLIAQSIGGGGGVAGTVHAGLEVDELNNLIEGNAPGRGAAFTLAIGANGGKGGNGAKVTVEQRGTIEVGGDTRAAATLQSIGGGGGMGAMASTYFKTSTIAPAGEKIQVSMAVGGKGGSGGDGGAVIWKQDGTGLVKAIGKLGDALRLQSIGGGGGVAGGVAVGAQTSDHGTKVRVDNALISINGKGGAGGHGALVDVENAKGSSLITTGEGGIAIVAQSIGGGGGLTQAVYQQGINKTSINLGGGKGDGGQVTLAQHGFINSFGDAAHGVLAQSIGGGGGAARVIGATSITTAFNDTVAGQGNGGKVSVTLGEQAVISTQGKGAYGVLAQSIGGGGGYVNTGTAMGPTTGTLVQTRAGNGNGGDVYVAMSGNVRTVGENATAVFAQSVGGGGGMVDGVVGRAGEDGQGSGGNVTVQVGGDVGALGKNASAIVAQSVGSTAGVLAVQVLKDAMVYGGSDEAEAIRLMDGGSNKVEIASGATVSALSGVAIRSVRGDGTQVTNHGTLQGSALFTQNTTNSIDNYGSLYAGEQLQLHGGTVKNSGVLYVGATAGTMRTTMLGGSYVQREQGSYAPTVDFLGNTAGLLQIRKTADLSGAIAVQGVNHLPGEHQFTVLQATDGLTVNKGFYSKGNAVFDYPVQQVGNTLTVGLVADFNKHNALMSEEQAELSQYLGRKWEAAEAQIAANNAQKSAAPQRRMAMMAAAPVATGAAEQPGQAYVHVFDTLALADNTQAYAQVLDQIANDAIQAPVAILPLANRMFLNRTMSCPSTDVGEPQSQEKSCFWGDIQGNWLDRSAHHDDSGFDYDSVRYIIGGQHPLGNGWVAGGGVSYERAHGKAKDIALRTRGDNFSGMAFVRKVSGPWSYAGALSAGYGNYNTDRTVVTAQGVITPSADWDAHFVTLRLQTAYTHQLDGFYIKPAVDVDVIYQHVPSYSEKGGGAFNLAFDSTSDVRTMISPSVELGARIDKDKYVLRPYVGLGVNWMPSNDWETDARLKHDNSGDRFHLSQSLPSVFGEYKVGMDIDTGSDVVLRAEWRQRFGDRYNDRSAQLQLGVKF